MSRAVKVLINKFSFNTKVYTYITGKESHYTDLDFSRLILCMHSEMNFSSLKEIKLKCSKNFYFHSTNYVRIS